ncbi:hypothetical protein BE11_39880 [Sorangium cellulosum]|nr:hypothetical protein BE11_39880 [Sorangium cellulosum]
MAPVSAIWTAKSGTRSAWNSFFFDASGSSSNRAPAFLKSDAERLAADAASFFLSSLNGNGGLASLSRCSGGRNRHSSAKTLCSARAPRKVSSPWTTTLTPGANARSCFASRRARTATKSSSDAAVAVPYTRDPVRNTLWTSPSARPRTRRTVDRLMGGPRCEGAREHCAAAGAAQRAAVAPWLPSSVSSVVIPRARARRVPAHGGRMAS